MWRAVEIMISSAGTTDYKAFGQDIGFRVSGLGYRVQVLEYRVQG